MIVTLTANPAIDRLVALEEPLERGAVVRTADGVDQPGGKGINVARVLQARRRNEEQYRKRVMLGRADSTD